MFQLLIALFIGIFFGTITGLLPGIHTNLIAIILLGASPFLLIYLTPLALIIFIASMAITHTFVDFIPSIYLGAPDEDTVLSIMPGHKFLLKGRGHEAILLTLTGSAVAIIILIFITPIFIQFHKN
jgi:putative membrane protein